MRAATLLVAVLGLAMLALLYTGGQGPGWAGSGPGSATPPAGEATETSLTAGEPQTKTPRVEPGKRSVASTGIEEAAPFVLDGEVLDESTGGPAASVVVRLTVLDQMAEAVTDAEGSFRVTVDPRSWFPGQSVGVSFYDTGRWLMHETTVALENPLRLRLRERPILRGQLITTPERPYHHMQVTVYHPEVGATGTNLHAASARLDEGGRFEVLAYEKFVPEHYLLVFQDRSSFLFVAEVPRVELVSPLGATIRRPVSRLVLEVQGEPEWLPKVKGRIHPVGSPGMLGLTAFALDERGRYELWMQPQTLDLVLAGPGHLPLRETWTLEQPFEHRVLRLEPVLEEGLQPVTVLGVDGAPVEGALVSFLPAHLGPGDLAVVGIQQDRTGADGIARLPECLGIGKLSAYHRDHGFVERMTALGSPCTIAFRPTTTLRVTADGGGADLGPLHVVVSCGRDGRTFEEHGSSPITVAEVEGAVTSILVLGGGGRWMGEVSGRALPEPGPEGVIDLTVEVRPAAVIAGLVVDAAGDPLPGLQVDPLDGAARSVVTDSEGLFQLYVRPGTVQQHVQVERDGELVAEATLLAGEPAQVITVD